ncbi:MAG TPA: Fur family transcriptional regulator [Anaeromyxobacter sp.]|nr:Fur family transcriptional regulator [Anaeromyxobacter sp.]
MRPGRTDSAADRRTLDALEKFEKFLQGKALRLTEARAAIVEAALAREGHYPIEELIGDLKRLGIRGSKATVYRTLPLLEEAGFVKPAIVAGDSRSYETTYGAEHHDHLVCRACGKVVEFEFGAFEVLEREVAGRYGFRLDNHHHELVGTCPDCLAREGGDRGTPPPGAETTRTA